MILFFFSVLFSKFFRKFMLTIIHNSIWISYPFFNPKIFFFYLCSFKLIFNFCCSTSKQFLLLSFQNHQLISLFIWICNFCYYYQEFSTAYKSLYFWLIYDIRTKAFKLSLNLRKCMHNKNHMNKLVKRFLKRPLISSSLFRTRKDYFCFK